MDGALHRGPTRGGLALALGLIGCAAEPGTLETEALWVDDGAYSVTFRLHSEDAPEVGRACTDDGTCTRSDDDGFVTVADLSHGEHTLELRRAGGIPTLFPVQMRQDTRYAHEAYTYSESGFVDWFLGSGVWDDDTTGVIDLWVVDRSQYGPPALSGAVIDVVVGDVYISPGGSALVPGTVTDGGPNWIVNVPEGVVPIEVTYPEGSCHHGPSGWESETALVEVPVRAGFVTTLGVTCLPRP